MSDVKWSFHPACPGGCTHGGYLVAVVAAVDYARLRDAIARISPLYADEEGEGQ